MLDFFSFLSSYHARTLGPVSFDLCPRGGEACKAEQRGGVPCMREVGHFGKVDR